MPKLAIYIPKQEMREVERWRKSINFSQVFMRALQREIRQRSRVVEATEDQLDKAADYYRQALAEDSEALVDCGHQLGAQHVLQCRLSPPHIRRLLVSAENDDWKPEFGEVVREAIESTGIELGELARQQGCSDRSHPTWNELLCSGYIRGVAEAWQQVCERMQDER